MQRNLQNIIVSLVAGLCLSSAVYGRSEPNNDKLEHFMVQLRTFDLNAVTENDFSITSDEYRQLQECWDRLSVPQKRKLLRGSTARLGRATLVLILVYDLNSRLSWRAHIEHLSEYNLRRCSITLSRFGSFISLEAARQRLADFLFNGPCMMKNGQLKICEAILNEAVQRNDSSTRVRLEKWEYLINNKKYLPEPEKVNAVNSFFNDNIKPQADQHKEVETDYWQSPIETIILGRGDCEDFAMAKYVSLRLLGIPADRLQVTIVNTMTEATHHALLFYYPAKGEDPLVLDNISFYNDGSFYRHILPLNKRQRMHRMCLQWAVNEKNVFIFKRGLKSYSVESNSDSLFPRFGMSIENSRRLLDGLDE